MIISIFQVALIIAALFLLYQSFRNKKRAQYEFKTSYKIFEAVLTIFLFLCFAFYDISSFSGELAFPAFAILTAISCVFYWIIKVSANANIIWKTILLSFMGCLFWLSLLSTIKLFPYLSFFWFPIYGLFAVTPLLFSILTLSEIRYQCMLNPRFKTIKILLFGLIPIIIVNFSLNFIFEKSNLFFEMFNPTYSILF